MVDAITAGDAAFLAFTAAVPVCCILSVLIMLFKGN